METLRRHMDECMRKKTSNKMISSLAIPIHLYHVLYPAAPTVSTWQWSNSRFDSSDVAPVFCEPRASQTSFFPVRLQTRRANLSRRHDLSRGGTTSPLRLVAPLTSGHDILLLTSCGPKVGGSPRVRRGPEARDQGDDP